MGFAITSVDMASASVRCRPSRYMWLKLVPSINWIVLEGFGIGMRGALKSVDIVAVDLKEQSGGSS